MAHFCLTGGWFSSDNVGDHAILCGLVDSFQKLDSPTLSVITAGPDKVRRLYGLDAYAPKRSPLALVQNLLGADALIFTGGTPFYEAVPHMTYYTTLATIAAARRIPVVVFGVSLRTLERSYTKNLLHRIARCASMLGGREQRTVDLFSLLASGASKAVLVPDAAVQMVPSDVERSRTLLRELGGDPCARNVAICMRDFRTDRRFQQHHYSRAYDDACLERYHQGCRRVAEHVIRKYDANVLLCPMHTRPPDDDRQVMREVRDSISDAGLRSRCLLIESQLGPRDMKGLLGQMHATVGVRFHSLVLSTSMGVPTVAICYAVKNQAIMDQMGQGQFAIDLARASPEDLISMVDRLMSQRESSVDVLHQRIPKLNKLFQERVRQVGELVSPSR